MTKTSRKIEENSLYQRKVIYKTLIATTILKAEIILSLKIKNRVSVPSLPTFVQHCPGSSS